MTARQPNSKRRRQGALLSLELCIALPVMLITVLAAIEFSFLLLGSQAITAGANVGARQAALPSTTATEVKDAVFQALGSWRWADADKLQVLIFVDSDNNGLDGDDLVYDSLPPGMADAGNELANAPSGTDIQVTINLRSADAAPDLLSIVHLGLGNQELTSSFVTRKE